MSNEAKIKTIDLIRSGTAILDIHQSCEFYTDSYSKEYKEWLPYITQKEFVRVSGEMIGRDSEILVSRFRKKTEAEKQAEDLGWQIKRLEERFNVEISYTQK